jgi:hypothetical protein
VDCHTPRQARESATALDGAGLATRGARRGGSHASELWGNGRRNHGCPPSLFRETQAAQRDRLVTSIATAGLTAAAVWYLLSGTLAAMSIPIALVVAGVVYHLSGREYDPVVRTKTRKLVIEQKGGEEPVPTSVAVAVAVAPDGLVIEQLGATMRAAWNQVPTSDRATFVRLAREYLGLSPSLSVEGAPDRA